MKRHYHNPPETERISTACIRFADPFMKPPNYTSDWAQVTCRSCRKVWIKRNWRDHAVAPWAKKKVEAKKVEADPTEVARLELIAEISAAVKTDSKVEERKRLEAEHGQIWDTDELTRDFEVEGFMAPFVVVRRKTDGQRGSLLFQGWPRFYWGFKPSS